MRRSVAARYARWSAGFALLLALATAGAYLRTKWSQHVDRRNAPAPAPVNVERQSKGLTFSKVEGDRKIFTVNASSSTDFKDKDATLLESVEITIFGKGGDRNDVIRTQSCQYSKNNGAIDCSGAVRMDLQSAADAQRATRNPSWQPQVVHVETSRVTFDRANGLARTTEPVKFAFPSGNGQARGVEYKSEEGSMRLLSDVQITLTPSAPVSSKRPSALRSTRSDVHVRGTRLDFDRNTRLMRLQGPAEASTETIRLSAAQMLLELDPAFRARLFRAQTESGKRPALEIHAGSDFSQLMADTLVAHFSPEGWVSQSEAIGGVEGARHTAQENQEFHASKLLLDLWPKKTQPKELRLEGAVVAKTQANLPSESRTLQTEALQVQFSAGSAGQAAKPQLAQTLAPGTLEWTEGSPGDSAASHTHLSADKLEVQFGPAGKADRLLADQNVRAERNLPGHAMQTATAKNGVVQLLPGGGWSQIELQGAVGLKEAERTASADSALFVHDAQTATLTGKTVVRDATTQTAAPRIVFHQATGDIFAEGGVRSTDLTTRSSAVHLASAPLNITADTLQANSKSGRAFYSGRGRLWQGDSVLEADTIELLRSTRTLTATNHVRAVFPQTIGGAGAQRAATEKKTNLWHIAAGSLIYYDLENRAHLERDVLAQSAGQSVRSPLLDLYFTRAPATSALQAPGPQQISRGVATGGVTVTEGTRKAVADRGEYSAADGKFVMSGGNPTIFDGSAGTTTGRQLTFFLADDTIIVDSENGSRTVTKHRVDR